MLEEWFAILLSLHPDGGDFQTAHMTIPPAQSHKRVWEYVSLLITQQHAYREDESIVELMIRFIYWLDTHEERFTMVYLTCRTNFSRAQWQLLGVHSFFHNFIPSKWGKLMNPSSPVVTRWVGYAGLVRMGANPFYGELMTSPDGFRDLMCAFIPSKFQQITSVHIRKAVVTLLCCIKAHPSIPKDLKLRLVGDYLAAEYFYMKSLVECMEMDQASIRTQLEDASINKRRKGVRNDKLSLAEPLARHLSSISLLRTCQRADIIDVDPLYKAFASYNGDSEIIFKALATYYPEAAPPHTDSSYNEVQVHWGNFFARSPQTFLALLQSVKGIASVFPLHIFKRVFYRYGFGWDDNPALNIELVDATHPSYDIFWRQCFFRVVRAHIVGKNKTADPHDMSSNPHSQLHGTMHAVLPMLGSVMKEEFDELREHPHAGILKMAFENGAISFSERSVFAQWHRGLEDDWRFYQQPAYPLRPALFWIRRWAFYCSAEPIGERIIFWLMRRCFWDLYYRSSDGTQEIRNMSMRDDVKALLPGLVITRMSKDHLQNTLKGVLSLRAFWNE